MTDEAEDCDEVMIVWWWRIKFDDDWILNWCHDGDGWRWQMKLKIVTRWWLFDDGGSSLMVIEYWIDAVTVMDEDDRWSWRLWRGDDCLMMMDQVWWWDWSDAMTMMDEDDRWLLKIVTRWWFVLVMTDQVWWLLNWCRDDGQQVRIWGVYSVYGHACITGASQ